MYRFRRIPENKLSCTITFKCKMPSLYVSHDDTLYQDRQKYDRTSCFSVFKAQVEGQTCDLWDVWSGQSLCVVSAAAQHLCYLSLHKQQLSLHLLQLLLDPERERG